MNSGYPFGIIKPLVSSNLWYHQTFGIIKRVLIERRDNNQILKSSKKAAFKHNLL
jgi:hypothetical protein